MRLFKKRNCLITIVNNETLSFVDPDTPGEGRVFDSIPLAQFLTDDAGIHIIPEEMKHRVNSLLIVPDYWFGNIIFKFQSRKKSIIEAFIERKLRAEYPDLPDIRYFFGYVPYHTEQREKELYVFFLQEPTSFQLYDQLVKLSLSPCRITTPAFVWEQKLKEISPDFHNGGKCLIHLTTEDGLLYFFFRGFFLFSRSITFPNPQIESSEKLNTLTYEINQSLYLFSQKAKADIDRVYIASSREDDAPELSDMLGREVKPLGGLDENRPKEPVIAKDIGSVSHFKERDLSPSSKFLSILHQLQRKELEWRPVQHTGIAVGFILLLLFGVESLFLWQWSKPNLVPMAKAGMMAGADPKHTLQQYNEALDSLIRESERPSPKGTIMKVIGSLPDHFLIKEMTIDVEGKPAVHIKGVVKVAGPDKLRDSLSYLLVKVKKYFQGARSIGIQDIDVEIDKTSHIQQGYQNYSVTLGFNLP